MASPKISTANCRRAPSALQKVPFCRGFSLIEVLVVLGLFAVVGSFSLVMSMESYRGSSFRDAQALLIAALQKARSEAMAGVCMGSSCTTGLAHGVQVTPTEIVIFQGSSYNPNDPFNEVIPLDDAAITVGGMQTVVFAELSGDTNPGEIILSDTSGHVATTTIGAEGQILW